MAQSALTTIRVACFDKFWPFSRSNADGTMSGIFIDAMHLLGQKSGIHMDICGMGWQHAQTMVQAGELDGFCTVPTAERRTYAEFCRTPLLSLRMGTYHRANDLRPAQAHSLEDLRQMRQVTYRGNGFARDHLEVERMELENDIVSALRRLAMGSSDSFVDAEIASATTLHDLGLTDVLRFTPLPFLPNAEVHFGLRKSFPDSAHVLARIESAQLALSREGQLQALPRRYSELPKLHASGSERLRELLTGQS